MDSLRFPFNAKEGKLCNKNPWALIPAGHGFVVSKDLVCQLVDKLIKTQVHLGFDLVVQELLFKLGQSIVGAVIVQIQRVEDVPEEGKTTAGSLLIVSVKVGRFTPAWAM